jgi:hypothetical protein
VRPGDGVLGGTSMGWGSGDGARCGGGEDGGGVGPGDGVLGGDICAGEGENGRTARKPMLTSP